MTNQIEKEKLADWTQHNERHGNKILWQKQDTHYNEIAFWKIPIYCYVAGCTTKTHYTNSDITDSNNEGHPICEKHLNELREMYHLFDIAQTNPNKGISP
jgi:hypothetical protein